MFLTFLNDLFYGLEFVRKCEIIKNNEFFKKQGEQSAANIFSCIL